MQPSGHYKVGHDLFLSAIFRNVRTEVQSTIPKQYTSWNMRPRNLIDGCQPTFRRNIVISYPKQKFSTLNREAEGCSETSVLSYQTAWRHICDDIFSAVRTVAGEGVRCPTWGHRGTNSSHTDRRMRRYVWLHGNCTAGRSLFTLPVQTYPVSVGVEGGLPVPQRERRSSPTWLLALRLIT
jgi:hypothetical protein